MIENARVCVYGEQLNQCSAMQGLEYLQLTVVRNIFRDLLKRQEKK